MKQANMYPLIITLGQFLNFSILWLSFFGCQFLPRDDWSMSLVMDSKLAWSPISPLFQIFFPCFVFYVFTKKGNICFNVIFSTFDRVGNPTFYPWSLEGCNLGYWELNLIKFGMGVGISKPLWLYRNKEQRAKRFTENWFAWIFPHLFSLFCLLYFSVSRV